MFLLHLHATKVTLSYMETCNRIHLVLSLTRAYLHGAGCRVILSVLRATASDLRRPAACLYTVQTPSSRIMSHGRRYATRPMPAREPVCSSPPPHS